jgi:class 3 adenylate cyclase
MREKSARHAAENLARFAVDATEAVKRFTTREGRKIQIRAGMHCGPCFGGVVGVKMPRFCLMGDTMNTASRMESTGSPGKVHISEHFKQALEETVPEFEKDGLTSFLFEDLGSMAVKGKGDMQTYFLEAPPIFRKGFRNSLLQVMEAKTMVRLAAEQYEEEEKEENDE